MTDEEYAESELLRVYGSLEDKMCRDVMQLVRVFSNQGHSGASAEYCTTIFRRLMSRRPLTPLTGEDDEWETTPLGSVQNKRYSCVYKKEDGQAYDSCARIFSEDGGQTWFTSPYSWKDIEFPYNVPDSPEEHIIGKD